MSTMDITKDVVVVDLDGTLALDGHRSHYLNRTPRDWTKYFAACGDDAPNLPIIELVSALYEANFHIHIVSGRSDEVRDTTLDWLSKHEVPFEILKMRPKDNRVDDHKLKLEMVSAYKDRILLVLEDRQRVVDMWRANGLTCLQVAPGNF